MLRGASSNATMGAFPRRTTRYFETATKTLVIRPLTFIIAFHRFTIRRHYAFRPLLKFTLLRKRGSRNRISENVKILSFLNICLIDIRVIRPSLRSKNVSLLFYFFITGITYSVKLKNIYGYIQHREIKINMDSVEKQGE